MSIFMQGEFYKTVLGGQEINDGQAIVIKRKENYQTTTIRITSLDTLLAHPDNNCKMSYYLVPVTTSDTRGLPHKARTAMAAVVKVHLDTVDGRKQLELLTARMLRADAEPALTPCLMTDCGSSVDFWWLVDNIPVTEGSDERALFIQYKRKLLAFVSDCIHDGSALSGMTIDAGATEQLMFGYSIAGTFVQGQGQEQEISYTKFSYNRYTVDDLKKVVADDDSYKFYKPITKSDLRKRNAGRYLTYVLSLQALRKSNGSSSCINNIRFIRYNLEMEIYGPDYAKTNLLNSYSSYRSIKEERAMKDIMENTRNSYLTFANEGITKKLKPTPSEIAVVGPVPHSLVMPAKEVVSPIKKRHDEILENYNMGLNNTANAKKVGVDRRTVYRVLKQVCVI